MKVKSLSRARLLATPWTAAYQASLSMGFSRQEYWSGVPLPTPSKAPGIYQPQNKYFVNEYLKKKKKEEGELEQFISKSNENEKNESQPNEETWM